MSEEDKIIERILSSDRLRSIMEARLNNRNKEDYKSNNALIEFWLDTRAYSKGAQKNYRAVMKNHFLRYLNEKIDDHEWNLQEISSAEIDRYRRWLETSETLGRNTKSLYYKIIKSFYNFYSMQSKRADIWHFKEFPNFQKLNLNPKEIDILNYEKEVQILTPKEAKIYLKILFNKKVKLYCFERLLYESGLRFIDASRIKIKFCRFADRYLFTEGKRGFRPYFLSNELIEHLKEYILKEKNEYLFTWSGRTPIPYNTYLRKIKTIHKRIRFPKKLSTKSGRKSFVTNRYYEEGQALSEIGELIGHVISNKDPLKGFITKGKIVTEKYLIKKKALSPLLSKFDSYNYLKTIF